MFYALMKLMYMIYFVGFFYVSFQNLSRVAFSGIGYQKLITEVLKAIGFGFVWPLSLLSVNGRKRLMKKTKGA